MVETSALEASPSYNVFVKLLSAMQTLGFTEFEDFGLKVNAEERTVSYSYRGHEAFYDLCAQHGVVPYGHVIYSSNSGLLLLSVKFNHFAYFMGLSPGRVVSHEFLDKYYDEEEVYEFNVDEVIHMLNLFYAHFSQRLQNANIEPTPRNILKLWTLEQHADSPVGIFFFDKAPSAELVEEYMLELVRADISMYLCFHALSNYGNAVNGEFQYTITALKELEDMPLSYVDYLFFPR